jgi:hypothetical protein
MVLSIGLVVLIGYLSILTVSAINKMDESKTIQSQNLNIGGVFGVKLGDSVESLHNNKEFSEVKEYSDLYKYNYISARLQKDQYQRVDFYALPESNIIYKIVYDTDDTKCDNLDGTFNKLRTVYGVGDYSFFDAFGSLKIIRKDNKSIKVTCSSKYFTGKSSENIIYLDETLESQREAEYLSHKSKKIDKTVQFN